MNNNADLIAERDALVAERQAIVLRRQIDSMKLSDSVVRDYYEAWGDLIDPAESLREPGYGFSFSPNVDQSDDRKDGMDRPLFQNEYDLSRMRGMGRFITNELPGGLASLNNLTNYIIGTNWDYGVVARESGDERAPSEPLMESPVVRRARGVIDEYLERNYWIGGGDREAFRRTIRDGDGFLCLREHSPGFVTNEFEEPSHVTRPANEHALYDVLMQECGIDAREMGVCWSFGVVTPKNRPSRSLAYHISRDPAGRDWDLVSDSHMVHLKASVDSNVKRGIPEYYPVRKHIPAADAVYLATAKGAAVQAKIAGVRKYSAGTTKEAAESVVDAKVWQEFNLSTPSGGSRTVKTVKYGDGTILDIGNYDWVDGPMGSQRNPNLILAGQAALRLTAARWCMPEWMTSGDASNNNLASSLVAESPFVKHAEAAQQFYLQHFRSMLWKVLYIAWAGGRFDDLGVDFGVIRQLVKLDITPCSVASRDTLKEAQVNEIEHRNGVISKRTWATLSGRDYDAERRHMQNDGDAPPTPPMMPGMPQPGMQNPMQPINPQQRPMLNPTMSAALQGAFESVRSDDEASAILERFKDYP